MSRCGLSRAAAAVTRYNAHRVAISTAAANSRAICVQCCDMLDEFHLSACVYDLSIAHIHEVVMPLTRAQIEPFAAMILILF